MADEAPAFTVRRARRDDLEQVVDLDDRVTGINKADYLHELFERYCERRPHERFFYVAEADGGTPGAVIGFVIGEIRAWEFGSEPCGWVFAISVDPRTREAGVGAALLERVCGSFRQAGVQRMRTMISRQNHLLLAFFRSNGLMAGPYLQLEKELA